MRIHALLAWWALFLTICTVAYAIPASAREVWVITDRKHPIKPQPGVRLIELDAPRRIDAELTFRLPSTPEQAAAVVRGRLERGGSKLRDRLAEAYQGVLDAWTLGVHKVPAVVVDRKYVVYGDTDVSTAISKVNRYRSTNP